MMQNPGTTLTELDRLAEITSRYARYSLSAGGLSSIVGGVLCLAVFAAGALLPLSPPLRYALAAAPALWIASKEVLRRAYYQRDGAVTQQMSVGERRLHHGMTLYLAAMALLIVGTLAWHLGAAVLAWPASGYAAIVVAMPAIAWRWFWSVGDFLIGVLLLCQSAVVLAGSHYDWPWMFIALSFSLVAIVAGWREHRDYLVLRRQLHAERA